MTTQAQLKPKSSRSDSSRAEHTTNPFDRETSTNRFVSGIHIYASGDYRAIYLPQKASEPDTTCDSNAKQCSSIRDMKDTCLNSEWGCGRMLAHSGLPSKQRILLRLRWQFPNKSGCLYFERPFLQKLEQLYTYTAK